MPERRGAGRFMRPGIWRMESVSAALVLVGSGLIALGTLLLGVLPGTVTKDALGEVFLPLGVLVIGGGVHTFWRARDLARGYRSPSAAERLKRDPRAPVVYLRSFRDDAGAQYTTLWGRLSQEQQMARVLGHIGPVIALGAPGDAVPPLGAARDYVSPEQWPTWLAERMNVASLVLCRVSDTEAFWSEVAMARAIVAEHRIAFLLPRDADRYSAFRTKLADNFPAAASLPAALPPVFPRAIVQTRQGYPGDPPRDLWGLLYFDANGRPQLRQIGVAPKTVREAMAFFLTFNPNQPYRQAFEYIFAPLVNNLGGRTRFRPSWFGLFMMLWAFYVLIPLVLIVPGLNRRTARRSGARALTTQ